MARVRIMRWWSRAALVAMALAASSPSLASDQDPEDRADPSIAAEQEEADEAARPARRENRPVVRSEAEQASAPSQAIVAGAIRVDGATALPQAAYAPAIEPYLGRQLSPADLRALARDVGDVARRAGYGLATAWVPPQDVASGVLRVRIDEGRIDAVEATGPAAPAVERLLRRLTGGAPVPTARLERQLLLAGDIAGVSLGRARLDRGGGRNVLRVESEYQAVRGRASMDNWGSSAIGPVRARAMVEANGTLVFGDRLTLGGTVTPLQPRELQFVHASYSLPLGSGGTEAFIRTYRSHSAAGGRLRGRDLDGDSVEIEAGLSHPLVRSRAESLWGHVLAGIRDSELTREGVLVRDDRIVTLTGLLYGTARVAGGLGRARMQLVQGLDALGATERGDPEASRDDAGGVFTKLVLWADYVRRLGAGFSVQLSGEGQLASRPLLASEEMGLGGRTFLRGYDYREFAGDRGIAGGAELRYDLRRSPEPLRRAQIYLYADAGRVENLRGGFGGGSLASAGGGVRLAFDDGFDAGVELGVPLARGFDGRRPDPRLSFTLVSRF
jgi:hemolysin activation/secretion protein